MRVVVVGAGERRWVDKDGQARIFRQLTLLVPQSDEGMTGYQVSSPFVFADVPLPESPCVADVEFLPRRMGRTETLAVASCVRVASVDLAVDALV